MGQEISAVSQVVRDGGLDDEEEDYDDADNDDDDDDDAEDIESNVAAAPVDDDDDNVEGDSGAATSSPDRPQQAKNGHGSQGLSVVGEEYDREPDETEQGGDDDVEEKAKS